MAKPKHDEAQAVAKSVADLVRERALRAAAGAADALDPWYSELADALRTEFRLIGYTPDQVERAIKKHVKRLQLDDKRVQAIADAIVESARAARTLPQETFDAVYGKGAAVEGAAPFGPGLRATRAPSPPLPPASEGGPPSTD